MLEFLRKDLMLVLAVALVIVSLSYAIGYVTKNPANNFETQPAFLEGDRAPRPQPVTSRTWKEHSFEKVLTLGSSTVAQPEIVRVASNGEIYVLDWADLRIKRFSPAGNLLSVFGTGKGNGVGTFSNPTSFSVAPNGELWVCDPRRQTITHFQPDGAAQTIAMRKGLYRIVALKDILITMAPPSTTGLFEVYSQSGDQLRSFGEFLQEQSQQGVILDGEIIGDESGGFIYGGRHLGVIAAYNAEGIPQFVARTIDRSPLPNVVHVDNRLKVRHSTDAVLSLSLLGDYVYVLSGTRADDAGGGQVMDVYDKRNGNYAFSLRLPIPCREAVVHADLVYMLGDEGVTAWRFRQSS